VIISDKDIKNQLSETERLLAWLALPSCRQPAQVRLPRESNSVCLTLLIKKPWGSSAGLKKKQLRSNQNMNNQVLQLHPEIIMKHLFAFLEQLEVARC
jgi:hypothetical protein